ncbi:unnamed protein product [Calicophoron daubneyi]|uniref:Granulins domain-containing protein n=1 Tax=Calicophoron daubneyi TaxID=300641 RepID=A0AAV2TB05_CALDB
MLWCSFVLICVVSPLVRPTVAWFVCPQKCDGKSCCEISPNKTVCCPYVNGVCCGDGLSCCPQGSTCELGERICRQVNGKIATMKPLEIPDSGTKAVLDARLIDRTVPNLICPDKKSYCSAQQTCCLMKDGHWGCCPMPSAVCCSDNVHCCPKGTRCDVSKGTCIRAHSGESAVDTLLSFLFHTPKLHPARVLPNSDNSTLRNLETVQPLMSYQGVPCADGLHECPFGTTCCRTASGTYGCCPMPDAVCCSDGTHCCPSGTKCDVQGHRCIVSSAAALQSNQSALVQAQENSGLTSVRDVQLCPDGKSRCLDRQTCCKLKDQTWGCCPLFEAVCCSDGEHCCPKGSTCDPDSGSCLTSTKQKTDGPVICPDKEFQCPSNSTCCQLPSKEWGCCPVPQAVCCPDGMHCCPKGFQCNEASRTCDRKYDTVLTPESVPWSSKLPALPSVDNVFEQLIQPDTVNTNHVDCPDGHSTCLAGSTCCEMEGGGYGCCPSPNAVCCEDKKHCCPAGTKCSTSKQGCVKDDEQVVPKIEVAGTPPSSHDNICPDNVSSCDDYRTCCPLIDGNYGCCPYNNGTCCADRHRCCPAGTVCSPDSNECTHPPKSGLKGKLIPGSLMHPARAGDNPLAPPADGELRNLLINQEVRTTFCSACQNGEFCCPDAEGNVNRMCCPHPGGTCCPGGRHCCPRDTHCAADGKCKMNVDERSAPAYLIPSKKYGSPTLSHHLEQVEPKSFHTPLAPVATPAKKDLFLLEPRYRALKEGRRTVCPDYKHSCPEASQCCPSDQHGYTCAPKDATCCSPGLNTYCPPGKRCSVEGAICIP